LDVKMGSGAFMTNLDDATRLASSMVAIGRHAGRRVVAVISDMNQPLGHAVGNVLEVKEAIDTLHGGGPADFREHCLQVGGRLLVVAGHARTLTAARKELSAAPEDGRPWGKYAQVVAAHAGDRLAGEIS